MRNPFRRIPAEPSRDRFQEPPANVDVPALAERRWIVVARAFAIAFFLSILLNLAQALAIVTLLPLKTVVPFLVTTADRSQQIVRMEPFTRTMPGFTAMTEKLVREYVVMRHTMIADAGEMTSRWGADGYIWTHSTTDEYRRFIMATRPEWKTFAERHITMAISVVSAIQTSPGFWQAEFNVEQREDNIVTSNRSYVASLRVVYEPQTVRHDERFVNPLGFRVADYTIARRETGAGKAKSGDE